MLVSLKRSYLKDKEIMVKPNQVNWYNNITAINMFRIWVLGFFRLVLLMKYLFPLHATHKISYITQKLLRFKILFLPAKEKQT